MSLLRSDKMAYYNIIIPRESAWEVLNELGQVQSVQLIDQNSNESHMSRPFTQAIRRADDVSTQLSQIEAEMIKYQKEINRCTDVQEFLQNLEQYLNIRGKAAHAFIDDVEKQVKESFLKINEQTASLESLYTNYFHQIEYRAVLRKCKEILGDQMGFAGVNLASNPLELGQNDENEDESQATLGSGLSYFAGAIKTEDVLRFTKVVFRTTKGNNWTYTSEIPFEKGDSKDGELKSIFIVVYSGGSQNVIKTKLNRLCDSFEASKFSLPHNAAGYARKLMQVDQQISDTRNLIHMTRQEVNKILDEWVLPRIGKTFSYIEELRLFVTKEKYIYQNMNLLTMKSSVLGGYFWCPEEMENQMRNSIDSLSKRNPNIGKAEIVKQPRPNHSVPPTHFRTNDFTNPFQEIVSTYGIPRYREVNPGLFCISMFPLKFGIMFGDIGHGGALFAFGAYLVYKGKDLLNTSLKDLFPLRYLLVMLGFFAFYCGWIYNDFLALPTNLFGSCYENEINPENGAKEAVKLDGCTYPFGFDPKWFIAHNELNFFNSYKMKAAVIFGVVQMLWGVFLKGMNCVHFDLWIDLIFEWLPQQIFLFSTFGYMCFMVILKWLTYYENGSDAPSIINQMINLPLNAGKVSSYNGVLTPLFADPQFQEDLQFYLLITSLICVPIMLLVKPLLLLLKSASKKRHAAVSQEEIPLIESDNAVESHDDDFSEIFVHQIIETIEFVLGTISNTASYLRLWALSLAHSQLAKVFFEKTIGGGIVGGSALQIIIGWFLFINISFAVLMCMDLMECFLHALRLQWVEFQNKFFKADGYKFVPFSFVSTLQEAVIVHVSS